MSEKRILMPWDDLTAEQKRSITNCTGLAFNDLPTVWNNILDHCTYPLRESKKWTGKEWDEFFDLAEKRVMNDGEVVRKVLEIATRPPEPDPWEEMDRCISKDALQTSAGIFEAWQRLKAWKQQHD